MTPFDSGEKIYSGLLKSKEPSDFINEICSILLKMGWTELPRTYAWQEAIMSRNPTNGTTCGLGDVTFTWRTTATGTYDVQIGNNVGESVQNLGQKMKQLGLISSFATKYHWYTPHNLAMSGYLRIWIDPTPNMNAYKTQFWLNKIDPVITSPENYHRLYRGPSSYYYISQAFTNGYRKFLSKQTPQGHRVILYVGWQIDKDNVVYPAIHMASAYDTDKDPCRIVEEGDLDLYPYWNPCLWLVPYRVYKIYCSPYFLLVKEFFESSDGGQGRRNLVFASMLKMLPANEMHDVEIIPDSSYFTRVRTQKPHNLYLGANVTFRGVVPLNGGPQISGIPYTVVNIINENEIHIDLDTRGYVYSTGKMGDNEHPLNAYLYHGNEDIAPGVPFFYHYVYLPIAAQYFWHLNGWTTSTNLVSDDYNSTAILTDYRNALRIPLKVTNKKWYPSETGFHETLVGWGNHTGDTENYWRGLLWDSFITYINAYPKITRQESFHIDSKGQRWERLNIESYSYFNFWMRAT